MRKIYNKIIICALCIVAGGCLTSCKDITVSAPNTFNVVVDGGMGSGTYNENSNVTLTSTPTSTQLFEGWYDGTTLLSSDGEYTFKISKDLNIKAQYSDKYAELTIVGGGLTITGGTTTKLTSYNHLQIECKVDYTLSAKEDQTKKFVKFIVDGEDNLSNNITINVTENTTVEVVYEYSYMVYASNGKIDSSDVNVAVIASLNDVVEITYVEVDGFTFEGWYYKNADNEEVKLSDDEVYQHKVIDSINIYAKLIAE